jgi:hypothetical protein
MVYAQFEYVAKYKDQTIELDDFSIFVTDVQILDHEF